MHFVVSTHRERRAVWGGQALKVLALSSVLVTLTSRLAFGASGSDEPWLWTRHGAATPQAISLLRELQSAEAYGLLPDDYARDLGPTFSPALGAPGTVAEPQFDAAVSSAVSHFLRDLHFGRVAPRSAGFDLTMPRPALDLPTLLLQLSTTDNVGRVIASVEPPFEHYLLLKQALRRYRRLASGTLQPTDAERRVGQFPRRVRQIELTLERWRWLPEFTSPPIIVNIPQFRLFAFESTQDRKDEILQMDVIVGRTYPKMRTPVFVADMKYVVFRPYWDVPFSITQREMLPAIRAKPNYLSGEHLEIVRGAGDSAPVVSPSRESLDSLASGAVRLRQRPGDDNALGLVKFMLPNSYNVYLHSTPAHHLFSQSRRAFSHGCIRVSDPVALAAYVLRNAPGSWSSQSIQAAMKGRDDVRVNLTKPIRVMILYGTVLATEDGSVSFFDDIYGHDSKLEKLLRLPRVVTAQ